MNHLDAAIQVNHIGSPRFALWLWVSSESSGAGEPSCWAVLSINSMVSVTAWAIRALWAAPGGAARYNQLAPWRAINNKPFRSCSDGRNSPSAARVEQGDLFKFYVSAAPALAQDGTRIDPNMIMPRRIAKLGFFPNSRGYKAAANLRPSRAVRSWQAACQVLASSGGLWGLSYLSVHLEKRHPARGKSG